MRYYIILVNFYLVEKNLRTLKSVHFVFDLNSVAFEMSYKYGVAQKYPPPPRQLSLRFVLGDTRDLLGLLQIGEKICLPSCSSSFGHILTKMPCAT